MRTNSDGSITLSQRNLLTLLAKIDQPDSARTLIGGSEAPGIVIKSEDDSTHYALREPGPVHPSTLIIMGYDA